MFYDTFLLPCVHSSSSLEKVDALGAVEARKGFHSSHHRWGIVETRHRPTPECHPSDDADADDDPANSGPGEKPINFCTTQCGAAHKTPESKSFFSSGRGYIARQVMDERISYDIVSLCSPSPRVSIVFRKPFSKEGGSTICWIVGGCGAEGRRLKANHFSLFSPRNPARFGAFLLPWFRPNWTRAALNDEDSYYYYTAPAAALGVLDGGGLQFSRFSFLQLFAAFPLPLLPSQIETGIYFQARV